MLHPQPLHRAVRTRGDTTGALLRVLAVAGLVVIALVLLGWPLIGGTDDPPPAVPAAPASPAGSAGKEPDPLVLPGARAGTR